MATLAAPRLRSLTLTLTERCNLSCAYCTAPRAGRAMAPEVADAAVDLLARDAADGDVTLSFYGGEPLLALGAVRRAIARARAALEGDGRRRLRVLTPTNGLLLEGDALAALREDAVDVAVSIDSGAASNERAFADGRPSTPALLERVPGVLSLAPRSRVLARVTATPANAADLAENVQALARLGFRTIVVQPAYEAPWDDAAIAAYGRSHRRLAAWLAGARAAGLAVPDVPGLRAIAERLAKGASVGPRRWCGAGKAIAAVSTDGGLYPCYRLVFRGDDPGSRLGDVARGFTNAPARAAFAAFDPEAVRSEDGACATCPAKDGCTHACPALGLEALGDVTRVPAIACRLMRAAVEGVRAQAATRRVTPRRFAAALATATALAGLAVAPSGCGGTAEVGATTTGAGGAGASTTGAGGAGGASTTSAGGSGGVGGDSSYVDAGGGICPVEVDAGGGVCPVEVDASDDAGGGGGVCKVIADAGFDPGLGDAGGGVCEVPPEAGGGGGLC